MHVISWNLQARRGRWIGRIEDRVALIQELGQENEWDVLLLQEVPEGGAEELVSRLEVDADAMHHSWPQLADGHKDAAALDPWWDAELLLLGPDAPVKDAYRRWLAEHPEERARIARLRPQGPLACSHMRGGQTPSRYDHILVSDEVQVTSCSYVVGDAFAAGSDHALVQAFLQVPGGR